jgi:hypothetical protein
VRQQIEIAPVILGELLVLGFVCAHSLHRPIAGKHALHEELIGRGVRGKLTIAEQKALRDARLQRRHEVANIDDFDDALYAPAWQEA